MVEEKLDCRASERWDTKGEPRSGVVVYTCGMRQEDSQCYPVSEQNPNQSNTNNKKKEEKNYHQTEKRVF